MVKLWQAIRIFFVAGWCAARNHKGAERHQIGMITKPGWRPVPITQCQRCAFMGIAEGDVQRFGGKVR